jgi:tetratricopeptide (TPR) repeat protein
MRLPLALVCAVLSCVCPRAAMAQDAPPAEGEAAHLDADTARRARAEFETGVAHYREGRFREAIRSFQVAASLTPSADLSFNIARAYEELARREGNPSDWEEAIAYYRRYLSDAVDPPDRADVEGHIAELTASADAARRAALARPTVGTLSIRADREGARVRVGDVDAGTTPIDAPLELAPGRYRLAADLEGFVPYRGEVTVEAGVRTSAVVELIPATSYTSTLGTPVFAWVSFGLAGAGLVGSVVLGALAASEQSAALQPFDMNRLEAARGLAGWSDAALGAAIGFAALGVVLYFAESAAVGTEVTHGPTEPDADESGPTESGPTESEPAEPPAEPAPAS